MDQRGERTAVPGRARILIVDDDPTIVMTLRYALENGGYECLEATNGADAIRVAREARPDLVLLDIMMPLINGFHVCRMIKSDRALAATPVVMITARGQERDYALAKEMGADDYLVKPFEIADLLEVVGRHLARRSQPG